MKIEVPTLKMARGVALLLILCIAGLLFLDASVGLFLWGSLVINLVIWIYLEFYDKAQDRRGS